MADPDRVVGDLVERYASAGEARGAAGVVSGGHNRVTAEPDEDRARAAAEQRTAMTPAGTPTEPAGLTGSPVLLPLVVVAGAVVLAVVTAIVVGGAAWIGGALVVGASLGWFWLQRRMAGDADEASGMTRTPGDSRTRLLPTLAIVALAVIAGVIIVGAIAGYL